MNHHEERAQIFQSFDSLKGFRQLLKQQERVVVERPLLSEDDLQELNHKLYRIKAGMQIQVCYLEQDTCLKLQGMVSRIDFDRKILQVVKKKIPFRYIVSLHGDEIESDPFLIP